MNFITGSVPSRAVGFQPTQLIRLVDNWLPRKVKLEVDVIAVHGGDALLCPIGPLSLWGKRNFNLTQG